MKQSTDDIKTWQLSMTSAHANSWDHSTTTDSACTPPKTPTVPDYDRLDRHAVPWYGRTFMIMLKDTNLAITIMNDGVCLKDIGESENRDKLWFCVEQDGYFGFQNPRSGKYLGHDGKDILRASASKLNGWEMFAMRKHPSGGYQILQPYYSRQLMVLCVEGNGRTLVRRNHGTTAWEFVRV